MDQRIIDLYDEYTHRPLERRVFLERLARLAGSAAAALALLPILENDYAHAAVIHENRGLNAHIEDVARRAADAGFLALAPDCLSPTGGTPANEDEAREKIGGLDKDATVKDLVAARRFLAEHKGSTGRVGAMGFCWGGGMVNLLAETDPDLAAGVVFYGMSPPLDKVAAIRAKLLLNYAGIDERINATVPPYEEALKAAGVRYQLFMYHGVQHAFHNDANTARYDAAAAALAWKRTVEFLKEALA